MLISKSLPHAFPSCPSPNLICWQEIKRPCRDVCIKYGHALLFSAAKDPPFPLLITVSIRLASWLTLVVGVDSFASRCYLGQWQIGHAVFSGPVLKGKYNKCHTALVLDSAPHDPSITVMNHSPSFQIFSFIFNRSHCPLNDKFGLLLTHRIDKNEGRVTKSSVFLWFYGGPIQPRSSLFSNQPEPNSKAWRKTSL